jgi:hypothetical protein
MVIYYHAKVAPAISIPDEWSQQIPCSIQNPITALTILPTPRIILKKNDDSWIIWAWNVVIPSRVLSQSDPL